MYFPKLRYRRYEQSPFHRRKWMVWETADSGVSWVYLGLSN